MTPSIRRDSQAGNQTGQSQPLTHEAYSRHCSAVAVRERRVPVVFVQIRRHRATLCGRVIELAEFAAEGQWFKVETAIGQVWAEHRQVRMCSADGRCSCDEGQARA